jgi:hypothetical protein
MAISFELSGVSPFTVNAIENAVKKIAPGVFVLDPPDPRGGSPVGFVGRSDADVSDALQRNVKGGYKKFQFTYAKTALDAFKMECQMWHEWKPVANPVHPVRPKGTVVPCIVCGK